MPNRICIERNVAIPMRDGVVLRADIFRPDSDRPLPVILCRLPYNKDSLWMWQEAVDPIRATEAGFIVVFQDTRGRYASEGEFYPFIHESRDGYDTIQWLASRPWCNGAVGMTGASYFGATQWLAAVEQPPALKAIFPIVTTSEYYESWTYQGGAFQLGFILYWVLMGLAPDTAARLAAAGRADPAEADRMLEGMDRVAEHFRALPLAELPLLRQSPAAGYYFDWLQHETNDDYWQATAINRRYNRVQVPAWNVGGWYDLFLHGTLENYVRMRQEGGSAVARTGQRLLVAPWAHGNFSGDFPADSFGHLAEKDTVDLTGMQLRFFGHYLKGEATGADQEPPVRLFIMGENRWRDEADWPLARARYTPWYLHSEGQAGTRGGSLSPERPTTEPPDVYLYDPRQPVPSTGGATFLPRLRLSAYAGPNDQQPAEARADVLVYTSGPLAEPLEVTGPLAVVLYAATSAPDTDFVARLCDVAPDGVSRLLAEGILRARYREGTDRPRPLTPGQVVEYRINLVATANLFQAGHRLRVDITSSSFPRFDPNPNTGHPLGQDGPEALQPALQTILHTGDYPSHIVLPVIPR